LALLGLFCLATKLALIAVCAIDKLLETSTVKDRWPPGTKDLCDWAPYWQQANARKPNEEGTRRIGDKFVQLECYKR